MSIKISKNRLDMGSTPIKNVSYQDLDQVDTQAAPATGKTRLYSKTDGALYVVPAAGAETAVTASIPAKVVVHLNDTVANIPTGWVEATGARGRLVVGMPASGTLAGTVGTALTDLQDPTHTHTGPSHTHTGPSHTHTYTDVIAHTHSIGGRMLYNNSSVYVPITEAANERSTTTASTGIATGTTAASGTGDTGASGTGASGATSSTMPYIQYVTIQKS